MVRYHIVFKGRVQGVGFRYRLLTLAQEYNIVGYVRNLSDGDVEAQMQGEKTDILNIISILKKDTWIRIDDYYIIDLKPIEEEGFKVLR